jgi:hypothetical protein
MLKGTALDSSVSPNPLASGGTGIIGQPIALLTERNGGLTSEQRQLMKLAAF